MFYAPYNVADEMHCWVAWRLAHGTAHSQLGQLTMPADKVHYGRESCAVWYLDLQHRINRLQPQDRRILVLAALGHTQLCIAAQIGYCLRQTVRYHDEACAALRTLDLSDRRSKHNAGPHPTERQVASWMQEPHCDCWKKRPGRPGPDRNNVTLDRKWAKQIGVQAPCH